MIPFTAAVCARVMSRVHGWTLGTTSITPHLLSIRLSRSTISQEAELFMSHGSDHDDESGRETPTDDADRNSFEAGSDATVGDERDENPDVKPGPKQTQRRHKSTSRRKKQRQKSRPKQTTSEQQGLVVTSPRQYSGSRGGVVTHVSCTINKEQIDIAQNDAVQNNAHKLFSCIECGLRFVDLKSLREHVSDKTIWTDRSLLGCRISVMWARNQWYEGMVTQYDMGSEKTLCFV